MTHDPDWKAMAVQLYEILTCANNFSDPPQCYGYTKQTMANRLTDIAHTLREHRLDKQFEELVRNVGIPVCDKCLTFACVVGRNMCREAYHAGYVRLKSVVVPE